jgi:endonuclease/exonuclease/phosphatase family metal-dependent hydrolase
MNRRDDGLWVVQTPLLDEGAHFYQYIVDGAWRLDPAHPVMEDNGMGGANSAMAVGGRDLGGPDSLRVASLNLHCYQEPDSRLKLEQVAFALRAMDVHAVALQEVGHHLKDPKQSNAGDFLSQCLERGGDTWRHEWMEAHLGFGAFREGVSLLSRGPLERVQQMELSRGALRRVALAAETEVAGVRLRLVSTHLSWPSAGGAAETNRMLDELGPERPEVAATLVAGDFNASPNTATVRRMRDAGFHALEAKDANDEATFGCPPTQLIDYIFARLAPGRSLAGPPKRLRIFNRNADGNVYQPRVSDHVGLLGVFDFG